MSRVSVLVPARNEPFLQQTVENLLSAAAEDVEIVVALDGYWPATLLPNDPRIKILHHGAARGMRPCLNRAAALATGDYLLKADAHTSWPEGYDVALKADYHEDNWILVPRRYPLDPETWGFEQRTDHKYPIDYHFLSEPFGKYGDSVPGLHGSEWRARRDARKDVLIDDELASQGSAWFMSRQHWNRVGPLNPALYGSFWYENQELALKTWCMGGAQKVTKNTWYAHLYKGRRYGRGYSTANMGHEAATAYTSWFWVTDQPFAGKVRTFRSVLEQFAPVPTWADIDAICDRAARELRNPYQVAA